MNEIVLDLSGSLLGAAEGMIKDAVIEEKWYVEKRFPIDIYSGMNKARDNEALRKKVALEACKRAGIKLRLAGFVNSDIYLGEYMHFVTILRLNEEDIGRRVISSFRMLAKIVIILRRWQRSRYEPGGPGYDRAKDSFYESASKKSRTET